MLPGRGIPPPPPRTYSPTNDKDGNPRRRITFMVGFWKGEVKAVPAAPPRKERGEEEAEEEEEEEERPGASMALPDPAALPCPSWLQQATKTMGEVEEVREEGWEAPEAKGGLAVLDSVWERIDAGEGGGGGGGEERDTREVRVPGGDVLCLHSLMYPFLLPTQAPEYSACFQGF